MSAQVIHGDCLDVLREMPADSVDSIVTDPPYGLSFMGKKWDYDVPSVEIWAECLRVLKPGGHLLAFAGTRTQHRMAVRIEDAGFEIRDMVSYLYSTQDTARQLIDSLSPEQLKLLDMTFGRDGMVGWGYGSGFPKSMDISKAIDKAAGVTREVVGQSRVHPDLRGASYGQATAERLTVDLTSPASAAAQQWEGWGTGLKPALEPITLARKPFKGTVAQNVQAHGTGALNVDGCRVEMEGGDSKRGGFGNGAIGIPVTGEGQGLAVGAEWQTKTGGRWPANFIHDGSEEVLALFPNSTSGAVQLDTQGGHSQGRQVYGKHSGYAMPAIESSSGNAGRFFYCAKASPADRHEGLPHPGQQFQLGSTLRDADKVDRKGNYHPTVKPTDLMRYLCRLVTPPAGVVLDPFCGSGSTGKAALMEAFSFIGIEREAEYVEIAQARLRATLPALLGAL